MGKDGVPEGGTRSQSWSLSLSASSSTPGKKTIKGIHISVGLQLGIFFGQHTIVRLFLEECGRTL